MGKEATRPRRFPLHEDDGLGFEELSPPPGPVMSVTINPRGRCYHLAKDIINRLARVQGEDSAPEPHITLQGIYPDAELAPVKARVARVAAKTGPFAVNVTGIGLLVSPGDPEMLYLHLHVEKSPELAQLYKRLKRELDSLGLRTYPYSPEEWVPHLTLASGRWSRRKLHELLRELDPELPVCVLPADEICLNRLRSDGEWEIVERYPFAMGA